MYPHCVVYGWPFYWRLRQNSLNPRNKAQDIIVRSSSGWFCCRVYLWVNRIIWGPRVRSSRAILWKKLSVCDAGPCTSSSVWAMFSNITHPVVMLMLLTSWTDTRPYDRLQTILVGLINLQWGGSVVHTAPTLSAGGHHEPLNQLPFHSPNVKQRGILMTQW